MPNHSSILIIDDDKDDQLMLSEYFAEAEVPVSLHFADNGLRAIHILSTIQNDNLLPGLIVMDLNMPVMNGKETLIFLKKTERYQFIPVIILSTSNSESEKRSCLRLGAVEYLVKPNSYDQGIAIVNRLVQEYKIAHP